MSSLALPTVALSLRQPWAWLVANGPKRIENRRWNTRFRGPFLIHAAKGMTRAEYDDAVETASRIDRGVVVPPFEALQRGGIVGRASLVDVLPKCLTNMTVAPMFDLVLDWAPCEHTWHFPWQHGFVLEDVAPLPFVPCRSALGFFKVGDDIVRELGARTVP